MRRSIVFILWLICMIKAALADDSTQFAQKLDEAKDYLTVNPAHSLVILDSLEGLSTAPVDLYIQWHLLNARASVPTNQQDRLYDSINAVFAHSHTVTFKANLPTVLSALGIWLRHQEYLQDAEMSLECAYKYAKNDRQRLSLMNSIALLARNQNRYQKARNIYHKARQLAIELKQTPILAMLESNLGSLALDQGKVPEAEQYFRSALLGYQAIDKRAGQISAGINLMFVFLIQKHIVNYERLQGPTSTLTNAFPNVAKQAWLQWLEARYHQLEGEIISQATRDELQVAYTQLESDKVKILVHRYLAKELSVDIIAPQPITEKSFSSSWFAKVKRCQW
ncbi:tetratricopeptide repeat protein [Pseudoalteromonas sp. McH1-7]|uniref:tetratricopeptide repeat protein n=2 Tax=unclassified Pseudoalteromonas TaxID=194690 RepID=UPI001590A52D|nr:MULTISPECIES: tetratricopeptide repeat protein [unclassified Pseudoalteromonas]NUZ10296.1 tetratricopeptide repeat protein [Pseudoalteromonas sp. McH1-7]USD27261.1 tetratricopeptide repeat protein [Pseudoalteromonas sp. SCSIO 43201]